MNPRRYLKALAKRNQILNSLFPEQLQAVLDPSPRKIIWTTRRAGKTYCCLADFVNDGLQNPYAKSIYIAKTHSSAKNIAWPILKELNRKFNLGAKFNVAELCFILPNESEVRLFGADKSGWADNLYGQKLRRIGIDEAAFFRHVSLNEIIEDQLELCLADLNGQLWLMSIPGRVCRGVFYDTTKDFSYKDKLNGATPLDLSCQDWSVHRWTTADNPHMAVQFAEVMARKIAKTPNVETTASFIRNYKGGWVVEDSERVYWFFQGKNAIEEWKPQDGDNYILGLDFGYDDATAFSMNVYNSDSPNFIELESRAEKKMGLGKVRDIVVEYQKKYGDISIVADPAHKQMFEEFRRRYQLPVYMGQKPNKSDWIEVINADYMAGNIKILNHKDSPHAAEMDKLSWYTKTNGYRVEQPGQKNDCCDAFYMAYRHAYHYRFTEEEAVPEVGTDEYNAKIEVDMLEAARQSATNTSPRWNDEF